MKNIMSISNGFQNRNEKIIYESLIYNILSVLAIRIIKSYKKQVIDQTTFKKVLQIQTKYLKKFEKTNSLNPKYSNILDQLRTQIFPIDNQKQQIKNKLNKSLEMTKIYQNTLSVLPNLLNNIKPNEEIDQQKLELQRIQQKSVKQQKINKNSRQKIFNRTTLNINQYLENDRIQKRQKIQQMPQLNNFRINYEQLQVKKIHWKNLNNNDFPLYKNVPKVKVKDQNRKSIQNTKFFLFTHK